MASAISCVTAQSVEEEAAKSHRIPKTREPTIYDLVRAGGFVEGLEYMNHLRRLEKAHARMAKREKMHKAQIYALLALSGLRDKANEELKAIHNQFYPTKLSPEEREAKKAEILERIKCAKEKRAAECTEAKP